MCNKKIEEIEWDIADFDRCTALITDTLAKHALNGNATKLQALYRGHRVRMEVKRMMVDHNERMYWRNAALRIQCMTRMHQARHVRVRLREQRKMAVSQADEHFTRGTMLDMAFIPDTPIKQCYT